MVPSSENKCRKLNYIGGAGNGNPTPNFIPWSIQIEKSRAKLNRQITKVRPKHTCAFSVC